VSRPFFIALSAFINCHPSLAMKIARNEEGFNPAVSPCDTGLEDSKDCFPECAQGLPCTIREENKKAFS
jgi:hypothetical protein